MADFSNQSPVKSYSFIEASIKALTSPSQATYRSLVQDPGASAGKGFLWVAVASVVSTLIGILLFQVFPQNPIFQYMGEYGGEYLDAATRVNAFGIVTSLLCGIPLGVFFAVLGFAIWTGLLHLIARLLGGTGDYGKLVYMMALIGVPFSLVSSILAPIPYLGCITFLITIYVLVLEVLAIDAVHQFGAAKAVLTILVPVIILCLVLICIVVGLGSFFYIAFQETFQNLPQEFPMP